MDLRAVYPTPEEPGTERSFEEIWAANRGMLDKEWAEPEESDDLGDMMELDEPEEAGPDALIDLSPQRISVLADAVPSKLVVHHDVVMLDENGAMIKNHDREHRPRKKKGTEINETQISKL